MGSLKERYLEDLGGRFVRCIEMATRKSRDYANDENPFENFELAAMVAGITPQQGMIYHIANKLIRIKNLQNKDPDVVGESKIDSIEDGINYFNIMGSYEDQSWDQEEDTVDEVADEILKAVEYPPEAQVKPASMIPGWFSKIGLGPK